MRIGIIARQDKYEPNRPFDEYWYLDKFFVNIFNELNVSLIPVVSENNIEDIASLCDGLVVTGSPNDINPKYYNEELIDGKELKFDEYPFVKKVVEMFNKNNKPILGICAGIQEINVIFGGTLYQHIDGHNLREKGMHYVDIEDNSFLYDVYKTNRLEVNSYHQQAIKDLASGFRVTAMSDDGVIEGIEGNNIYAVQWHPEALMDMKIFESFIDICKK